jgi:hypothetical protein
MILTVALVAVGLGVLFVAALVIRLSRGPIVFTASVTSKLTAVALRDENARNLRCTLRYTGQDKPHTLTDIQLPRELAQALGASPPSGFTAEPFVVDPKGGDEAFVNEFNAKTVRWVGQLALPVDQDVVLNIPVQQPRAGSGTIQFRYEHRGRLGGSSGYCALNLESQ